MAAASPALLEGLRGELRREGVKLWLPPYTPAAQDSSSSAEGVAPSGPLETLAAAYAPRLGAAAETIAAALEELRLHALEKLLAKTRVTLLARVAGSNGRREALRVEFDTTSRGEDVRAELCRRLNAAQLKAIASGRSLQDGQSLGQQGWPCDVERQGQPLKVLLFPSGEAPASGAASGAASSGEAAPGEAASGGAATEDRAPKPPEPEPRCSVAQIREAAEQMTAEGFGDFELTDAATGRLVPVPPAARQALIAAIALHALGRELLYGRGEGEAAAAGALEFLTEADHCFQRCREAGAAQLLDHIENFGQLQLDICWAYALLGDADHLPDAEKRLQSTERLVQRRVDRNFLTLAEVKAEQGHVLPPEVLPSVRLWLLRGIARRLRGDTAGARDDLSRAATFMRALRVESASVDALLSLGASREQAVAALRRCGGSAERAAEEIMAAEAQRRAAERQRGRQRELGQTTDGSFVDDECLARLESMGIERKAAIEALKKTNNDLDAAVEVVASSLKGNESQSQEVDELALASLLSMGFERGPAEEALRRTPGGAGVEEALLALTADPSGGSTSSGGGSSASPAGSSPKEATAAAAAAAAVAEAGAAAASEADAKAEADRAAKRAKKEALAAAKELVERELGNCLRRQGVEDDLAGASLFEEEALLQQHLSGLEL